MGKRAVSNCGQVWQLVLPATSLHSADAWALVDGQRIRIPWQSDAFKAVAEEATEALRVTLKTQCIDARYAWRRCSNHVERKAWPMLDAWD